MWSEIDRGLLVGDCILERLGGSMGIFVLIYRVVFFTRSGLG